jgi:rhamnogalacturonyl hydrolase YesR
MFKANNPENLNRANLHVSLLRVFSAVFLAAGLAASAHASGILTGSSGDGWHALTISPAATGTFTAFYDATPSVAPENAVIGLSNGAATTFGNNGCIARFNPTGQIDAYNGTGYVNTSINYSAGVWYHFRFVVNLTTHTYSVYVTPAGGSELTVGLNYAFRSTANTMTSLTDWNLYVDPSIGGASLTAINFTVPPGVDSSFQITSLAGPNGSISPSSPSTGTTVNFGSSQTFTITPNSGFMVSNVIVDGVSQGVINNSYTFSNVRSNGNITVSFQPLASTFTITASAGSGGTITASNATGVTPLTGAITVIPGSAQWFTFAANPGFAVSSVTVDGSSVALVSPYKFSNVQANHTISVAFQSVPTFTITPSAGANGTINPLVPTKVNQGSLQWVTIAPNFGYTISNVIVDGASVGAVTNYTFTNVQANHTISATFASSAGNSYFTSAYILQAIRTVTDYAVEHPSTDSSNNKALPYTWPRAALADALAQSYTELGDTHYLNAVNCWAEGNRSETYWLNGLRTATYVPTPEDTAPGAVATDIWQPASRNALPTTDAHWFIPGTNTYMDIQYHADDSSAGHAYMQLYDLDPTLSTDKNYRYKVGKIAGIQTRMDYVISNVDNLAGRKVWWWADAYFMAAPNLAHLAKLFGTTNPLYAQTLDNMYWDSSAYLFSPSDNMFYRDDKYFPGQLLGSTAHGDKVIWTRAQGWTLAALTEILTYLPSSDPQYQNFVAQFKNLAAAAKACQQPSGLWHTSLYDQNDGYPGAGFSVGQVDGDETSGSAFITYGIAWGIQNGLLTGYDTVVKNAWVALQSKIQPNGSLGYSEIVGQTPAAVNPSDTTDFGTGAFALAGLKVNALYGTH